MGTTPRLFVTEDLGPANRVKLGEEATHYLARVLRLGPGDRVRLFNGRDGEVMARIETVDRREITLCLEDRLRAQTSGADVWLLFAPLKKTRTDFVIEKATELGASRIFPVSTERTEAERVRVDRLARIVVEAAEQTERLDLPPVEEGRTLLAVLSAWEPSRILYFCDESHQEQGLQGVEATREGGLQPLETLADAVARIGPGPAAILVGPEGGFTESERKWLRSLACVTPVGLGPRILRAETAALAALAIWQNLAGDWRSS